MYKLTLRNEGSVKRKGLDTLVVRAENYECHRSYKGFINESVSIPPHEYNGNVGIEITRPFLKPVVKYDI